jgi:hypothetical protein
VISFGHVTCLAPWGALLVFGIDIPVDQVGHAVFCAGIHLLLRMIKPYVTGFTGFRFEKITVPEHLPLRTFMTEPYSETCAQCRTHILSKTILPVLLRNRAGQPVQGFENGF